MLKRHLDLCVRVNSETIAYSPVKLGKKNEKNYNKLKIGECFL